MSKKRKASSAGKPGRPKGAGRFFLFPLQVEPLVYALALALGSLLFIIAGFLGGVGMFLAGLVLLAVITRYVFRIVLYTAHGLTRTGDFPFQFAPEWAVQPWILFGATALAAGIVTFVATLSLPAGFPVLIVLCPGLCLLFIALAQHHDIAEALHPASLAQTLRTLRGAFALLAVFFTALCVVALLAGALLIPKLGMPWIIWPVFTFALVWLLWVCASMTGYVMLQHHNALGIDLLDESAAGSAKPRSKRPPAPPRKSSSGRKNQDVTDSQIDRLLDDGDVQTAQKLAYEDQRRNSGDMEAHRRYHRALLAGEDENGMLYTHARRFIELLIHRDMIAEAFSVLKSCRAKDETFMPESAATTLKIAQYLGNSDNARAAMVLLSRFDKAYPRESGLIPEAYAMAIRLLLTAFGRRDKAMQFMGALIKKYPDSPWTEESRELIRTISET